MLKTRFKIWIVSTVAMIQILPVTLLAVVMLPTVFFTIEKAFGFAPNHQEACCIAMVKKESTEGLACERLNLTLQQCESMAADFYRAAQAQAQQSNQRPPQQLRPQSESSQSLQYSGGDTPARAQPKRKSFSKSDVQVIAFLILLLIVGAGGYFLGRGLLGAKSILTVIPRLMLVLLNAVGIGFFAWASVLKALCSIGNSCKQAGSTALIIFIFPGLLIGVFFGVKYLLSGWRRRNQPWTKDLTVFALLIGMIVFINLFKLGIP